MIIRGRKQSCQDVGRTLSKCIALELSDPVLIRWLLAACCWLLRNTYRRRDAVLLIYDLFVCSHYPTFIKCKLHTM